MEILMRDTSGLPPGQAREWQRELQALGSAGSKACGVCHGPSFCPKQCKISGIHGIIMRILEIFMKSFPYCFIFTSYPHGFLRSERRLQVDQNQHHQGSSGDGRPTRWCHRGAIVVAGGWVSCMSRCHGAKCLDLGAQQFFFGLPELFWSCSDSMFFLFFCWGLGSTFRVKLYIFSILMSE